MKNKFFLIFFSLISLFLFSSNTVLTKINPEYVSFGEVYSENTNVIYKTFASYLKESFSYKWSESYFNAEVKTMLSNITRELSEMLPVKSVVFSKINDEKNNKSFMFIAENNEGKKYVSSVVLDDSLKIIALDIKRSY